MRDCYRDAQRALLALVAGPMTMGLALLALVGWLGYCAGGTGKPSLQVAAALRDTVRIVDSVFALRAETVTVRQRAVTRYDTIVRVASDTQYLVRDSLVTVPVEVIQRDVAKDSLIVALYQKDTTWQWRMDTHRRMYQAEIRQANAPRWGVGATLGYGCSARGCGPTLAVGLTYQAKLPNVRQLVGRLVR